MGHFLIRCTSLTLVRDRYMPHLPELVIRASDEENYIKISRSERMMIHLLIDPEVPELALDSSCLYQIEKLGRCMLYALHCQRAAQLAAIQRRADV